MCSKAVVVFVLLLLAVPVHAVTVFWIHDGSGALDATGTLQSVPSESACNSVAPSPVPPPPPPPPPPPDRDGDGVSDPMDGCPDVAGPAPSGCPPPPTDRVVVTTDTHKQVVVTIGACPAKPDGTSGVTNVRSGSGATRKITITCTTVP